MARLSGNPIHLALAVLIALVAVLLVEFAHYPNIGLPFGYWAYPNAALSAFRECDHVIFAELTGINHDLTLEEFEITVHYETEPGYTFRAISFPEYPEPAEIAEAVATIGCE